MTDDLDDSLDTPAVHNALRALGRISETIDNIDFPAPPLTQEEAIAIRGEIWDLRSDLSRALSAETRAKKVQGTLNAENVALVSQVVALELRLEEANKRNKATQYHEAVALMKKTIKDKGQRAAHWRKRMALWLEEVGETE